MAALVAAIIPSIHAGSISDVDSPASHPIPADWKDEHHSSLVVAAVPSPTYSLTSESGHLGNEFVRCIEDFNMTIMPHIHATAQLGRSLLLDAAADVLIQVHRYSCPLSRTLTNNVAILQSYGKAWRLARLAIRDSTIRFTDETLAGVSLMAGIDCLLYAHGATYGGAFGHWRGLTALLLARSSRTPHQSQAACASVHAAGPLTFIVPAYTGQDSPFEAKHCSEAEPASLITEPTQLVRLKRSAQRVGVALPRLLRSTREALAAEHGKSEATKRFVAATMLAD
ncbi:hypothetical protein LTR56_002427 [Elasticomyces elasticus]|nr:hypothetical protein LTR22_012170 [Elasticomyces elasticus]KAK3657287.1 hypothetical protein LTR56_002427 [Elasticomyces elasticus]KAK4933632.1 hypothetical protein LTR49_000096 [Elasticomyces elasticus]KAK5753727.1 hypothetical protein LTS12_016142 [Elasticomyces elasticus]